jgi:hypothetical protein
MVEPFSLPVLSGLVIVTELELVIVVVDELGEEPAQLPSFSLPPVLLCLCAMRFPAYPFRPLLALAFEAAPPPYFRA